MSIKPIYRNLDDIKDDRFFVFGDIWKVRDELINIPNADRVIKGRKLHFTRCIIIVQNNEDNFDEDCYTISIAPISSRTDCERKNDVVLFKGEDGVRKDSIVMLDYIQPMLKKDLYQCVGKISEDRKYDIYANISEIYGQPIELSETDEFKDAK